MAKDNKEIGRFDLSDIPPAPRGTPQIEVAFDIDADGILHVSAKDMQSGKQQKIRIEAKSGLNENEIKRMLKEAEDHADEDKKRKEEIETLNEGEALLFRAQKSLAEYKDRIPGDIATSIQTKIDALKKAHEAKNADAVKVGIEELNTHLQKIGEAMQKQGASAQPQGPSSQEAKKPDIEEAEVEILDEEKK